MITETGRTVDGEVKKTKGGGASEGKEPGRREPDGAKQTLHKKRNR